MLYSKGISNDSDCPIKPYLKMINDLKSIANYGKTHATSGYEYACNGNTSLPISSLQNRLLYPVHSKCTNIFYLCRVIKKTKRKRITDKWKQIKK